MMWKCFKLKKTWMIILIIMLIAAFYIHHRTAIRQMELLDYHPITQSHGFPSGQPETMRNVVTILVLEGGGAEGIVPLHVLSYLEKTSGKPISQLFDVVSATSTGAIIAAALGRPASLGSKKPYYSAQEILAFYNASLPYIFSTDLHHQIFTLWGLIGPQYDQSHLAKIFQQHSDPTDKLSDLIIPTIIPTFSLDKNAPFIFTTYGKNSDYYVTDVLQAATAAPTIFAPVKIYNLNHTQSHTIIDGAIFDNNPALTGLLSAMLLYPDKNRYVIVDLGTGNHPFEFSFQQVKTWGLLGWFKVMIDVLLHARQNYTSEELGLLHQLYPNKIEYYQIDYLASEQYVHPFTGNPKTLQYLNKIGELTVKQNRQLLDKLAQEFSVYQNEFVR